MPPWPLPRGSALGPDATALRLANRRPPLQSDLDDSTAAEAPLTSGSETERLAGRQEATAAEALAVVVTAATPDGPTPPN